MTLIKGRYKGTDGEQQIPVKVDRNGQVMVEVNDIELTAIVTDLDIMAEWDENDRCKVNLIPGQAGITGAAGVVGAATPRVTLASDDPAVTSLAVLDDWDASDRCKTSPIVGQNGVAAGSGASDALTQRMILATNDPAVTALQIMDDWDQSDRCKVNVNLNAGVAVDIGTGNIGLGTQRVNLANDDKAVTALEIMDDWDESDRCKVNIIPGAAVDIGSGNVGTGTLRVTLSNDGVVGQCQNTDDSAIGTKGLSIIAKAKTSQRAAVADGDAVQLVANEYGELVISGHTWATRSVRIEEIDPLDQKYVGEVNAAVSNQAAGTYNYYVDMGGYSKFALHMNLTTFTAGSTVKVYGTLQDDGTAPASCTYIDVTNSIFGVASFTASGLAIDDIGTCGMFKYLKIEVVIGVGGGGVDDYTLWSKRMY